MRFVTYLLALIILIALSNSSMHSTSAEEPRQRSLKDIAIEALFFPPMEAEGQGFDEGGFEAEVQGFGGGYEYEEPTLEELEQADSDTITVYIDLLDEDCDNIMRDIIGIKSHLDELYEGAPHE